VTKLCLNLPVSFHLNRGEKYVSFNKALRTAANRIEEGATLDELKAAAQDLRALAPESALADLVAARLAIEEKLVELEGRIGAPQNKPTGV
jgi:hypothetical protein